jgi:hypothetical protein
VKKYVALFAVVIALSCAAFLAVNALSKMRQQSGIRVTNKTQAISDEGTVIGSDDIRLKLRNNYNKDITAIVISIGHFSFKEEFIYSETDKVLVLGEIYDRDIPLPSSLKGRQDQELVIRAIVFADKTSEGDQKVISEIEEERLGEKVQIQRILPKLKQALESPGVAQNNLMSGRFESEIASALDASESDTLIALNALSPQIATIKRWPNGKISEHVNSGLKTGKEAGLHKLQRIKNNQQNQSPTFFQEELTRLIEHYEKVSRRL